MVYLTQFIRNAMKLCHPCTMTPQMLHVSTTLQSQCGWIIFAHKELSKTPRAEWIFQDYKKIIMMSNTQNVFNHLSPICTKINVH